RRDEEQAGAAAGPVGAVLSRARGHARAAILDVGVDRGRRRRYFRRGMAFVARALRSRVSISISLAVATSLPARAWAVDPFEIQVYDGTANDPLQAGLEVHLNTVASGIASAPPPLLPADRQTHLTFEPSFGMTPWWEIGGYLQTTLRGDGHFDYAGSKVRSKLVTPPGWHEHVRLGVNFEISMLPSAYD